MGTDTSTLPLIVLDATGKKLGRLASETALLLRGKHAPSFAPYRENMTRVHIVNVAHLDVSGKKLSEKTYWRHSGYLGGLKKVSARAVWQRDRAFMVRHAVSGMLPKNRLRAKMLRRLSIFSGEPSSSRVSSENQ